MNLGVLYHIVGAAACMAISYGVNQHQRPTYEPVFPAQAYTEQGGTLQLNYHGQTLTFPVMTAQVIAQDISRMTRVYALRELSIRATGAREQLVKLDLYVDLTQSLRGRSPGAGDPRALLQAELPVSRNGRFGAKPSYVVVDEGQLRKVISGNLLLTEANPASGAAEGRYRAAGRLELQLDGPAGVELITGRLDGLIAWDAPPPSL